MIAIKNLNITKAFLGETELRNIAIGDELLLSSEPEVIIMTSESNAAAMAVCYAQDWAAHADYMTQKEAENVTSIGTAFQSNTDITNFEELQYFKAVTDLANSAFEGCSALESINLDNILTAGSKSLSATKLEYAWMPVFEGNSISSAANGMFTNCKSLKAIRFDSITKMGALSYGSTATYWVVTTASVPTLSSGRVPSTVYVRDDMVNSFSSSTNWSSRTVKALSSLETDHPECPWISDLRDKGLII